MRGGRLALQAWLGEELVLFTRSGSDSEAHGRGAQ